MANQVKPEALSIQDVAVILGVHENTVRNWIAEGILVAVRVGPKLLRVPRSELTRLRLGRLAPDSNT